MKDPGFRYFRDYYHQLRSVNEASVFLRPGRIVSEPVCSDRTPKRWIIDTVFDVGFRAVSLETRFLEEPTIFLFETVVFPGNTLYALEFDEPTESKALDEVKARRQMLKG